MVDHFIEAVFSRLRYTLAAKKRVEKMKAAKRKQESSKKRAREIEKSTRTAVVKRRYNDAKAVFDKKLQDHKRKIKGVTETLRCLRNVGGDLTRKGGILTLKQCIRSNRKKIKALKVDVETALCTVNDEAEITKLVDLYKEKARAEVKSRREDKVKKLKSKIASLEQANIDKKAKMITAGGELKKKLEPLGVKIDYKETLKNYEAGTRGLNVLVISQAPEGYSPESYIATLEALAETKAPLKPKKKAFTIQPKPQAAPKVSPAKPIRLPAPRRIQEDNDDSSLWIPDVPLKPVLTDDGQKRGANDLKVCLENLIKIYNITTDDKLKVDLAKQIADKTSNLTAVNAALAEK